MAATSTMTALVVRGSKQQSPRLSQGNISIPSPREGQALVKISHVAQNPTDVQSLDSNAFGDDVVLGCDVVGEVVELGSSVKRYKLGDIVAGLIWGGEQKGLGGYSQYTLIDENISFPVPPSVSRQHACTVPLACATAWLALYSGACLAIDRRQKKGISVLIWGGSSSVGLYAIQLAAMYGLQVVTTCSPKHADLVRSYGARHVFDYRDEAVITKIREVAPGLKHIFDTIGNATSSVLASGAFEGEVGNLCTVRPGKTNTENVTAGTRVTDVLVWTAFLKDHSYGDFKWPASKEDHELSSELFDNLPSWLHTGSVKPSHPKILPGLESVPKGFQEHRDGNISAYKIVYSV